MVAGSPRALNKQEQVYRMLRERILSGEYSPGYRLVIDALRDELGMSIFPIREAIRRLEAEGLVIYQANAGARVTPTDPDEFERKLAILAVLEGYATALAAPELRSAELAALVRINDAMAACLERFDPARFLALDQEFHRTVCQRCPNPDLVDMWRDTGLRLDAVRRRHLPQLPFRGRDSVREHRRIIELIRTGATFKRIEGATRAHKLKTVEAFRRWRDEHEA